MKKTWVILSETRGDYVTRILWLRNGMAEISGGKKQDAIRYSLHGVNEVIGYLNKANGDDYSAERV